MELFNVIITHGVLIADTVKTRHLSLTEFATT